MCVLTAQAAHLDSGVREAFLLRELHLEAQVEIRAGLLVREKGVERDFLLHRAAYDFPILDPPPLFLRLRNFPAIEGFSVEKGDGSGVCCAAKAEYQQGEFHED